MDQNQQPVSYAPQAANYPQFAATTDMYMPHQQQVDVLPSYNASSTPSFTATSSLACALSQHLLATNVGALLVTMGVLMYLVRLFFSLSFAAPIMLVLVALLLLVGASVLGMITSKLYGNMKKQRVFGIVYVVTVGVAGLFLSAALFWVGIYDLVASAGATCVVWGVLTWAHLSQGIALLIVLHKKQ